MGNKNVQLHIGIALSLLSDCDIGRRSAVGKVQSSAVNTVAQPPTGSLMPWACLTFALHGKLKVM